MLRKVGQISTKYWSRLDGPSLGDCGAFCVVRKLPWLGCSSAYIAIQLSRITESQVTATASQHTTRPYPPTMLWPGSRPPAALASIHSTLLCLCLEKESWPLIYYLYKTTYSGLFFPNSIVSLPVCGVPWRCCEPRLEMFSKWRRKLAECKNSHKTRDGERNVDLERWKETENFVMKYLRELLQSTTYREKRRVAPLFIYKYIIQLWLMVTFIKSLQGQCASSTSPSHHVLISSGLGRVIWYNPIPGAGLVKFDCSSETFLAV